MLQLIMLLTVVLLSWRWIASRATEPWIVGDEPSKDRERRIDLFRAWLVVGAIASIALGLLEGLWSYVFMLFSTFPAVRARMYGIPVDSTYAEPGAAILPVLFLLLLVGLVLLWTRSSSTVRIPERLAEVLGFRPGPVDRTVFWLAGASLTLTIVFLPFALFYSFPLQTTLAWIPNPFGDLPGLLGWLLEGPKLALVFAIMVVALVAVGVAIELWPAWRAIWADRADQLGAAQPLLAFTQLLGLVATGMASIIYAAISAWSSIVMSSFLDAGSPIAMPHRSGVFGELLRSTLPLLIGFGLAILVRPMVLDWIERLGARSQVSMASKGVLFLSLAALLSWPIDRSVEASRGLAAFDALNWLPTAIGATVFAVLIWLVFWFRPPAVEVP